MCIFSEDEIKKYQEELIKEPNCENNEDFIIDEEFKKLNKIIKNENIKNKEIY